MAVIRQLCHVGGLISMEITMEPFISIRFDCYFHTININLLLEQVLILPINMTVLSLNITRNVL